MCARVIRFGKSIFWLLSMALAPACQEVIDLALPVDEPQLVIEGFLTYWEDTPQKNNCTVIISTTGDYYDANDFNPVNDATVELIDLGSQASYTVNRVENNEGIYKSVTIPLDSGRSYKLRVDYAGQSYEATGTLLPVAELDTFTYRYQPEQGFLDEGFYLYFSGRTPKERGINYYRFLIYENDSLYNAPEDYLIQTDEFLKEDIDTLQLANYAFDAEDTVRIEMYSLNKDTYEYYNELLELLFNDGGLFSSPPRNPSSNIQNITDPGQPPLGFFQVSTAFGETVVIEEE